MKLTIGMIVKNEEKWLEKCLTAIRPILDNVDSELIITDTGSVDRTVEIARKFTDNVLFFEWIKDFSAARNFGLKKAHGEWFLMLDADDIFQSCENIIEFFNSGEYKKYNAASYLSRNLIKMEEGVTFSDMWVPRLVKLRPETKYEGAVHEALNTFAPPFKNIHDIALHYGYYYENEEEKKAKLKRNSELLLKRLETEKDDNPMLYVQLYEGFVSLKEREKEALNYLEKGEALAQKMNSIVLAVIYFHKASYYYTGKDYIKALEICEKYFTMDKKIRPYPLTTDGEIIAIKAGCHSAFGRYDEAISDYKAFFEIYRDIESGHIATYDAYLYSSFLCTDINIMPLMIDMIDCCINSGKYNTAEFYLTSYPLSKYLFEMPKTAALVCREIIVLDHFGYRNIKQYFRQLDTAGKELLAKLLLIRLYNAEDKKPVLKALENIDADKLTGNAIKILSSYISGASDPGTLEATAEKLIAVALYSIEIKKIINNDLFFIDTDDLFAVLASIGSIITGNAGTQAGQLAVIAFEISKYREAHDYKKCVGSLKNAVSVYPDSAPLVSEYSNIIINEYDQAVKQAELEKLSSNIKNNIRSLISEKNTAGATKLLEQYKSIAGNDPDIIELEKSISTL